MMRVWCACAALFAAPSLLAQPAPPVVPRDAPILQQQRVSAAYRESQQAAFEAKLAEQDVLNTQYAYKAASQRAEVLKAELEKAIKARDAAREKEAAARKRYDDALNAVPR